MFNHFSDNIGANRAVMALSLARLGDAVGNSMLFIILPLYVAKLPAPLFHLPKTLLIGLLISAFGLINSFLQPLTGTLADRLGKRKPIIEVGLILVGLSTFAFTFANNYSHLFIMRMLQGIGVAMTIPASLALMTAASQKETRGGSMGIYTTMRIVGFAAGPLIGGFLFERYGFSTTFLTGAAFIFVGLAAVHIWVEEIAPERSTASSRHAPIFDRNLLSAGLLGVAFATFAMSNAFSMITTLENEFNARLNITAFAFAVAFSVLMVSRLITQLPLGRLSDTLGRKPLLIGGLILMAPATALLGYVNTDSQLIILRILQGVASAGVAAPAFAVAADLSSAGGEGRQLSIVSMGFGLGSALGPLLAGLLAVYSFELPFLIAGVMSLLGSWVVWRYVPETVDRSDPAVQQHQEHAQAAD